MLHESHLISIWSSLLLLGVAIIANRCSDCKTSKAISAPDREVDGYRRQRRRKEASERCAQKPLGCLVRL